LPCAARVKKQCHCPIEVWIEVLGKANSRYSSQAAVTIRGQTCRLSGAASRDIQRTKRALRRRNFADVIQITRQVNGFPFRRVSPRVRGWSALARGMNMSDNTELSIDELDAVIGGMSVPTNEAQIISAIKAKNFANGSIFTGNSSFGDTIDNNNNLP
jgi:hypothetical protein